VICDGLRRTFFLNLLKYLREFVWLQGGRNVSITVYDRWKLEVSSCGRGRVASWVCRFDQRQAGRYVWDEAPEDDLPVLSDAPQVYKN
jgi:hypothetical protein